jgi:hypothetical protein
MECICKKEQPTQTEELNNRDNDLVNIFNTSKWDKWDLYMEIIGYLVSKWFLQEWEKPTQIEERCQCKEKYRDEDNRCPDCCKLVD